MKSVLRILVPAFLVVALAFGAIPILAVGTQPGNGPASLDCSQCLPSTVYCCVRGALHCCS